MAIIAIAGGTGAVGKTIVEGIVAHGGHSVFVLSRTDVEGISKILQENQIDTVISAMGVVTPETNQAQINLVKASNTSSSTRRFIVSAYDMLHTREYVNFVNLEKKWAVIPGDGSARANFITTQDMAKYIARLVGLDKWSKVSSIVAQNYSISEILELAEKTRGPAFRVAYDDLEKLKSGKISFIEDFPDFELSREESEALFAKVHYYAGIGKFLVPTEDTLNSRFPDIVPKTAAQVLEESWQGK
ncbi:hypothetical protein COL5a_004392 [Colletotrichum fioriniae]|nr:hypothetical protein COL5a_004392 [Colletotrichum fioriniae]